MNIRYEHSWVQVRKALDQAFETQNGDREGIGSPDEASCFCSNPAEYEWKCLGKREMLVPYNHDAKPLALPTGLDQARFPSAASIRWEKRLVWIVEGTLVRGESNVMARRCFYLDVESWAILLGEGYDGVGVLIRYYMLHGFDVGTKKIEGVWYMA